MRALRMLIVALCVASPASGEDLTGQMATVVRPDAWVMNAQGERDRLLRIGTVIPVQAIEDGWVLIRPAGSDVPGERVSRSCVVRSSEARTYLKRMTEEAPSPDAWANYAEFLERTDRGAAFDCLVKAFKLQFNHQRVHILMGRAFEQAGMTPEAENSFKAAEHLGEQFWFRFERERDSLSHEHQFPIRHPDVHWPPPQTLEATAFCGLGFYYLRSPGDDGKPQWDRAVENFREALSEDRHCTAAWCGLAETLEAQGKIDDAILALAEIIGRNPRDHVHLLKRARLLRRQGDLDHARRDLDLAVINAADCPCALIDRARFFTGRQQLDLALKDIEASRRLGHAEPLALVMRAECQAQLGEYDGALADLESYRQLTSDLSYRPFEGLLWEMKQDYQKARDVYRSTPQGLSASCRLQMRLGNWAEALTDCDAMVAHIEQQKKSADTRELLRFHERRLVALHRTHAYLLERTGRLEDALAEYTLWSRFAPTERLAPASSARVLKLLGRDLEAGVELQKAYRIDKKTCTNLVARGAAKEATGDEAGALDDYLAADRIHGKCGASLASLSWIRSTALDGDIRNGMLAVQNAERAFTFKGAPTRRRAEILAAAYAEAGDYQQALDVLQKEMEDADSSRLMTLLLLTDAYRRREPIRVQSWEAYAP